LRKNALKKDEDRFKKGTQLPRTKKSNQTQETQEQAVELEFKKKPEQKIYFTDVD